MGDALGAIFGGGGRQQQTQTPDPTAQSLNRMREEQLGTLFSGAGGAPFWSFGQPGGAAYEPSPGVDQLLQMGMGALGAATPTDQLGGFGFQDYLGRGTSRDLYEQGLAGLDANFVGGRSLQQGSVGEGRQGIEGSYAGGLAQRDQDYARARDASQYDLQGALARSTGNYQNLTDQARGYISQIATPQIMQQMALQGLEGGGAVPAAIARASAEYGTPLAQQYMAEQTGLGGQAMGLQGALGQGSMDIGAALGGQRLGALAGLSQADLAALSSLTQTLMQGRTGLTGQQMGTEAAFTQGLPGAAETFATMPAKQRLLGAQAGATTAQAAQGLFPLADYSRGLREQDLLRRQGVAQTGFTGIPFTPGSTTTGKQSQQPLFNFFGQG